MALLEIDELFKRTSKQILNKFSVVLKVAPIMILVAVGKYFAHKYHFEFFEMNAIFTSLVAGTIFLIGFLISGVLSDYKESEKLPSELAASLRTLRDDCFTINRNKDSVAAQGFVIYQKDFYKVLMNWFFKRIGTNECLEWISNMNNYISDLEKEGVGVNYIIRLKNEQNSIRKMVMRIDTIREIDFIGTAYTIVEIMGLVITVGMVIIKIEPFMASMFFSVLVSFLISYMFFLIRDLDNPFDYSIKGESGTEVSLKPLHDLKNDIYSKPFLNN